MWNGSSLITTDIVKEAIVYTLPRWCSLTGPYKLMASQIAYIGTYPGGRGLLRITERKYYRL